MACDGLLDNDFRSLNVDGVWTEDYVKKSGPIRVGRWFFIGTSAIILKGVETGDYVMIGAGSIVTTNVPPNTIFAVTTPSSLQYPGPVAGLPDPTRQECFGRHRVRACALVEGYLGFGVTFGRRQRTMAFAMRLLFTNYFPIAMALAFLAAVLFAELPRKGLFVLRAMVALILAVFLAHVNRLFGLWPEHLLFPSGHTTFCLGLALSLGMLRPWTLAIALPLVPVLGYCMVTLHFHTTSDILGAIPLVLVVYGFVHWFWRLPSMERRKTDRVGHESVSESSLEFQSASRR